MKWKSVSACELATLGPFQRFPGRGLAPAWTLAPGSFPSPARPEEHHHRRTSGFSLHLPNSEKLARFADHKFRDDILTQRGECRARSRQVDQVVR
jgi:hypothetical protein